MKGVIRFLAGVALGGLAFLYPGALPAEEGPVRGEINGTLVNGTTGAPVPNMEVLLQKYEGEKEGEKEKTLSDSQGRFFFGNLEGEKGTGYSLQAKYKGVEYFSPLITFDPKRRKVPFELLLYEPTDSPQNISVIMHHVFAEPREGALWVQEVMVVQNSGKTVYVGAREIAPDKKETLRFSLPPEAQELQLLEGLMGCCIVQMEDSFSDTMDIKPGKKEIMFAYKVGYRFSSLKLEKLVTLGTDSLDFFIPDRGIHIQGENVRYAGLIGEGANRFFHLAGKKLSEGTRVALQFRGLPLGRKLLKGLAAILGVALVGFGVAYPFIKRRKGGASRDRDLERYGGRGEEDDGRSPIWAIAELDDQLEAGQISKEEHARKRDLWKREILKKSRPPDSPAWRGRG